VHLHSTNNANSSRHSIVISAIGYQPSALYHGKKTIANAPNPNALSPNRPKLPRSRRARPHAPPRLPRSRKNLRHPRLPGQILGHGQTNPRTTSRANARRTKSLRPRSRSLGPKRQHHGPPQIRRKRDRAPSHRGGLAQHRPQKFVGKIRIFRRLRATSGQGDRDSNLSEGSKLLTNSEVAQTLLPVLLRHVPHRAPPIVARPPTECRDQSPARQPITTHSQLSAKINEHAQPN